MAPNLQHPGGGSACNYKKIDPFFFFAGAEGAKRGAPAMVFLDVIVNVCCRRLLHREEYSFE